jgi:hypothetical protein
MGLAFPASLISIRVGISVALSEILVGVAAGDIHFAGGQHLLQTADWSNLMNLVAANVSSRHLVLLCLICADQRRRRQIFERAPVTLEKAKVIDHRTGNEGRLLKF